MGRFRHLWLLMLHLSWLVLELHLSSRLILEVQLMKLSHCREARVHCEVAKWGHALMEHAGPSRLLQVHTRQAQGAQCTDSGKKSQDEGRAKLPGMSRRWRGSPKGTCTA